MALYVWLAQADSVMRRDWSFDYDDLVALILAGAALITIFVTKKTRSISSTETVDGGVLEKFLTLTEKVGDLERQVGTLRAELADTQEILGQTLAELTDVKRIEEYLRGVIHEKDKELAALRQRVLHLEQVCRRAGINGNDLGIIKEL